MTTETNIGNITDFSSLLQAYGIEIPLIQRDYVQGRIHQKEIDRLAKKSDDKSKKLLKKYLREKERRNNFVSQLIAALENPESAPIQLTFIYGTIEKTGANNARHEESLTPLDGQQRLTTLFLLAWILIYSTKEKESLCSNEAYKKLLKGMRSFCYKTRPSSGAFCSAIMNENIQVENIQSGTETISKILEVQSWFGNDWKMDPSVRAMLQMLDEMERQLKGKNTKSMLENLLNGKGISFDLLDMVDYRLTDNLYIKMNARGKQLTEFENWKSEFIELLNDTHKNEEYTGIIDEQRKTVFGELKPTLKEYFSHSIEHQWTDLFWKYCIEKIKKHYAATEAERKKDCYPVIDEYFMEIFKKITQILFFVNNTQKTDALDYQDTIGVWKGIYEKKENVESLFAYLDLLCHFNDEFFNEIFYTSDNNQNTLQDCKVRLFEGKDTNLLTRIALKDNELTDRIIVLLFAILKYTKEFGTSINDDMKYFVRSVRNTIESKQYLLSKDARMVYDFNLNDIVSKKVLERIDSLIEEKKNNQASWKITPIEAAIEDFSFICGNFRGNSNDALFSDKEVLYNVLKEWDALQQIEKVQLLVGYGFTGHYIMTCAHGELNLFGTDSRWKSLFVHNDEKENGKFDQAMSKIVNEYHRTGNKLINLLEDKKNSLEENIFNFRYYALKYDHFMSSHAKNKTSNYYFSIKDGKIENLDFAAMVYSAKPAIAYHTDPFVYTLMKELQEIDTDANTEKLYLAYSTTGATRACLYIFKNKEGDDEPIAIIQHKAGEHKRGGWIKINGKNTEEIEKIDDIDNIDRIAAAKNWLQEMYPNTSFKERE